ncbi:MAG: methyltransferase [Planctomycetaceae bacterium]|nr:methyltransferase [Planctomycetales bacterium]MCB9926300.1 methyltransferase [Planctomycetaceae bacterium]
MSYNITPHAVDVHLKSISWATERGQIDQVQSQQHNIDRLVGSYVANAFESLQLQRAHLERFSDTDYCRAKLSELKLPPAKVWWIQLLAKIALNSAEAPANTRQLATCLRAELPSYETELTIITRVGENLLRLMQCEGTSEIVHTLFADDLMTRWYTSSVTYNLFNALARETVRLICEQTSAKPMNILEVGAGTGGLTSHLLELFDPSATRYHFTDIGAFFLRAGRRRFANYGFVEFATLDLERDCNEQGFPNGSCSLVIANNVLHDTKNLRFTLQNVSRVLAPGGYLLMLELTDPQVWWHMCFGSLDGWWRFKSDPSDDREELMLLKSEQWSELLAATGFDQTTVLSDSVAPDFANRLFLSRVGRG